MTTVSTQFGQSTIDVVLNEGQLLAKLTTDASGNTVLVDSSGASLAAIIRTVTIGNQAGTYPSNLSVPTATSAVLTYYPVLFGGIEVNEANATVSGADGARAGIIVPSGFRFARFSSLIAAADNVNNTTGAGWYAVRIRSVGTHGTLNLGNTRQKALAADAFSTPSTNVFTTTPWFEIGVTQDINTANPLVSVGDKIEAAIWQNSGVTLSMPFDIPSTWLMAEFR